MSSDKTVCGVCGKPLNRMVLAEILFGFCQECYQKKRLCSCGQELSVMSGSKKCSDCRSRDQEIKKQTRSEAARQRFEPERLRREAELRQLGRVLFHSCIANICDAAPPRCGCRKWVTVDKAKELIRQGLAVDWISREACFHLKNGGDIVTSSKLKRCPRSATIEKSHIERSLSTISKAKTPEQLKANYENLQRRIALDRTERAEEERYRWDVWAELSNHFFAEMTKEYSAEEFDAGQKESYGRPGILASELRSSFSRDIGSEMSFSQPTWSVSSVEPEEIEASESEPEETEEPESDELEGEIEEANNTEEIEEGATEQHEELEEIAASCGGEN